MDRELAELIAKSSFKSSAELGKLVPVLKEHLDADEYQEWAVLLATTIATINSDLLQKIFQQYPEIETQFDQHIEKFGYLV